MVENKTKNEHEIQSNDFNITNIDIGMREFNIDHYRLYVVCAASFDIQVGFTSELKYFVYEMCVQTVSKIHRLLIIMSEFVFILLNIQIKMIIGLDR